VEIFGHMGMDKYQLYRLLSRISLDLQVIMRVKLVWGLAFRWDCFVWDLRRFWDEDGIYAVKFNLKHVRL
jgi:hypothetical protein